jgi:hypothetical protein
MSRAALPTIALSVAIGAMTACAPTQQPGTGPVLSSQPGQLFCHIQLAGGGSVLAAIVDATATAAAPAAGPLVVVATGQTKAFVDDACTKAAQQTAGAVSGEPVSPPTPALPVQQVSIAVPPNQITLPVPAALAAPRGQATAAESRLNTERRPGGHFTALACRSSTGSSSPCHAGPISDLSIG